jgi:hypothetical protein
MKNVPFKDFGLVTIPFTDFTPDFWDDAMGGPIHSSYCPDDMTLQNMQRLMIWREGVSGKILLEIQLICAVGCVAS